MFDSADLDHDVDKATYRREEPRLREALLNAQCDLKQRGSFATLILIAGVEGAGKGETVKFWLAIGEPEQYRRLKARETVSLKRFKITEEDWRNRKKWDEYELAVCDMVDRTSTTNAAWTLVEANNKYYARIKVLKTFCAAIEAALERVKRPR